MCWSCQGNKLLPSRIKLSRYPKYPPLLMSTETTLFWVFLLLLRRLHLAPCMCVCVCVWERERERKGVPGSEGERRAERECEGVRERENRERERESWASDGRNDSEGDLQASRLAASSRRRVLQGDFPWLRYPVVHWLLASSLWVSSTHLCKKQTNK
jgi:hypothetical protein